MENNNIRSIIDADKIIHEPARVVIMSLLNAVDSADFVFLMNQTGLTQGNLSSHLSKLEAAAYIEIEKTFHKKRPRTIIRISQTGREAFSKYMEIMKGFYNSVG
ncbi:MAG TPA: ArsR family transcriptional regulator [Bacteroidales bacterium]|nr:ArsR family transcriptional regulator [Bacteroidales bacterium]